MNFTRRFLWAWSLSLMAVCAFVFAGCGGGYGGGGGGGGGNAPSAPTGFTAQAGNAQVALNWTASSGATGYYVNRSTTAGSETRYATVSATTYTDTGVTNSTTYYYKVSAYNSYGEGANSSEVSATPSAGGSAPAAPTNLTASPGNGKVDLSWTASSGATSYNVKRGLTSGSEAQLASTGSTTYSDTTAANGTKYYYVVSASNGSGTSGNSNEVSATPTAPPTAVAVTIDIATNRHAINPNVYGGSFPKDTATITDSGLTNVRWGGNGGSTYNWQLFTDNADNDYYFEDFTFCGLGGFATNSPCADSNSTQFITDVKAAGSNPLMTMVMLPWVAQSAENGSNNHWSFPDTSWPSQCKFDPYNSHAGDGLMADCTTQITAKASDISSTYFPLLDSPQPGDPANSVYRSQWTAALATAFGGAPHYYDMDNEIDIWGGTHRDIHPNNATYNELRDTYLSESRALKGWDPAAIRFGPVSCCWYFYWRSATGSSDTLGHGGVDFLPWWLNEVAWSDAVAGTRSLDVFDIHAYPDAPNTSSLTLTQKQALALRVFRDWWDPTYASEATYIQNGGFSIEPADSKPFRIPRMRALVNTIYPGTQFSITEWSAEFAGAADFSTALNDAEAYGILGRERVDFSSRWTAPNPVNPNYQTLKLYRNFDGAHGTFGTTSVAAMHNADPNLFSVFAALGPANTPLTLMVINKDPSNAAQVTFTLNGFTPGTFKSYQLSQASPTTIVASPSTQAWSATQTFPAYSVTLLVATGAPAAAPVAEWSLNPDTIQIPAGGSFTLQPMITSATSGSATVTLNSAAFDSASPGSITITAANLTQIPLTGNGSISIAAGAVTSPGFYHFTVMGTDSGGFLQKQGGWVLVQKPAATFTKTGDLQTGMHGTTLTLSVTLNPGSSGGTSNGATVLFSTNLGNFNGAVKATAVTNGSGVATVTLTLPVTVGPVQVTAEGPYGLGHPVATFTETSN